MDARPFLQSMFERGENAWSWEYATTYLLEALSDFSRGISTSEQLYHQMSHVDTAVLIYKGLQLKGMSESDIADRLRAYAVADSAGPTPSAEPGRHRGSSYI